MALLSCCSALTECWLTGFCMLWERQQEVRELSAIHLLWELEGKWKKLFIVLWTSWVQSIQNRTCIHWPPPSTDWAPSQYKLNPLASSQYKLDPLDSSQYNLGPVPVQTGSPGHVPVRTGPCLNTNWISCPLPCTDWAPSPYKLEALASSQYKLSACSLKHLSLRTARSVLMFGLVLCSPARSRELYWMILIGPFQPKIFCDSMHSSFQHVSLPVRQFRHCLDLHLFIKSC